MTRRRAAAVTTYGLTLVAVCTLSLVALLGRIGEGAVAEDLSDEVAALVVRAEDLDGYVTRFSGGSFDPFLADRSALTDQAVAATIVGRHARSYHSLDRSRVLSIEVSLHADADRYRSIVRLIGAPQTDPLPGVPSAEHSVISDSGTFVERMAVLTEGNLGMRVTAGASGPNASDDSLELLVTAIELQLEKWRATGGIGRNASAGAADISLAPLQLRLALFEVLAIVGGALLLGLRTVVSDRGTRERTRLLLSRCSARSTGLSVAKRARSLRRRSALAGSLSVLAAVSVVLAVSALCLPLFGVGGVIFILAFFAHGLALRATGLTGHGTRVLVPRFQSWSRPIGVVAVAATIFLLGSGAGALYASVVTDSLGAPGYSAAQTEAAVTGFRFSGGLLVLVSPVPLIIGRRIALLASSAQLQRDKRRQTLLHRSFADDGLRIRSRTLGTSSLLGRLTLRRWERFEEVVARAVAPIGPIVALSDPGTRLPQLGAVRETAPDHVWRDRIGELIDTAALIVNSPTNRALRGGVPGPAHAGRTRSDGLHRASCPSG